MKRDSRIGLWCMDLLESRTFYDVTWDGSASVWETNEDPTGYYYAPAQLISVEGSASESTGVGTFGFNTSANFNFDEGGGFQTYSLRGGATYGIDTFGGAFSFDLGVSIDPATHDVHWSVGGELNATKAGGFSDVEFTFNASEDNTGFTIGFPGNSEVVPTITFNFPENGQFNVQFGIQIHLSF